MASAQARSERGDVGVRLLVVLGVVVALVWVTPLLFLNRGRDGRDVAGATASEPTPPPPDVDRRAGEHPEERREGASVPAGSGEG